MLIVCARRARTVRSPRQRNVLRKVVIAIAALFVASVAAITVFVALFDWNRLKPLITARASVATGRELDIRGPLDVDVSWQPLVQAEDIVFENAEWASDEPFLTIERLSLRIRLLDLLRGRVVLPHFAIEGARVLLEKDAEGRKNWDLTNASAAEAAADTVVPEGRGDFPFVRDFLASDVGIVYRAAGEEIVDTYVKRATGRSDAHAVQLEAVGRHQKRPAKLVFDGASIRRLWDEEKPYPLRAALDVGAPPDAPDEKFSARAEGSLVHVTQEGRFDLTLHVAGSDMAQLFPLFRVVMPPTPPYELKGRLLHEGTQWVFDDFDGRMGESDLGGRIAIDSGPTPPHMEARLVSQNLVLDDLAGLVGGEPEEKKRDDDDAVFSSEPIDLERLHAMNVNASLDAKRVRTKKLPIDDVTLKIALKDGVLRAVPARFGIGGGAVELDVTLNGASDPLGLALAGEVRRVPFAKIVGDTFDEDSSGFIDGQLDFASAGKSVKDFAAALDGEGFVAMSGGKVSHLLVELIGLDVFEALGVLITEDKPIDVRCGVAKVTADDGIVRSDTLVFDTEDTMITGDGIIDLKAEKANVVLVPHPKDFSLFTVRSPIRVAGKLSDVDFYPDAAGLGPGGKVKQVVSTALSALIGLLPPFDDVLAEDSPCRELLDEARESMSDAPGEEEAAR